MGAIPIPSIVGKFFGSDLTFGSSRPIISAKEIHMEDNFDDSFSDTWQSEAESMDHADQLSAEQAAAELAAEGSNDYWNDVAGDAEADGNALESVYGCDEDVHDIDRCDDGDW
jgi:hypothetical protein